MFSYFRFSNFQIEHKKNNEPADDVGCLPGPSTSASDPISPIRKSHNPPSLRLLNLEKNQMPAIQISYNEIIEENQVQLR